MGLPCLVILVVVVIFCCVWDWEDWVSLIGVGVRKRVEWMRGFSCFLFFCLFVFCGVIAGLKSEVSSCCLVAYFCQISVLIVKSGRIGTDTTRVPSS